MVLGPEFYRREDSCQQLSPVLCPAPKTTPRAEPSQEQPQSILGCAPPKGRGSAVPLAVCGFLGGVSLGVWTARDGARGSLSAVLREAPGVPS